MPASQQPAGLELLYDFEKDNITSPYYAFVLSLHWSVARAGLRLKSDSGALTERLPTNWPNSAVTTSDQQTKTLVLNYYDPTDDKVKYEIRVVELTANDLLAVTICRSSFNSNHQPDSEAANQSSSVNRPASSSTSGNEKNTAANTFQICNFLRVAAFEDGRRSQISDVYEHADTLETQLYETLLEPIGLRVLGQPPVPGPYDDLTKSEDKKSNFEPIPLGQRPSPIVPEIPLGPLHVPPVGGFVPGVGRSDLDPLGRFGEGNILNPRSMIQPSHPIPNLPGGIMPGARFDPFGPPNPNNPLGRRSATRFEPNPDHERPPAGSDYDDMFM